MIRLESVLAAETLLWVVWLRVLFAGGVDDPVDTVFIEPFVDCEFLFPMGSVSWVGPARVRDALPRAMAKGRV